MNKYLALQKDVFDISKVTVVGSPTITSDGVASGFSSGNVVQITNTNIPNEAEKVFKMRVKWRIGNWAQTLMEFSGGGRIVQNQNGNIEVRADNNTSQSYIQALWTPENNAVVDYVLTINANRLSVGIIVDGVYRGENAITLSTTMTINKIQLGYFYSDDYALNGSIDLKEFKIYADNQLTYSPTKPTYLLERRKEGYDPSKFTIVGSPTITEYGVASGLDNNNYLDLGITKLNATKEITVTIHGIHGETQTVAGVLFKLRSGTNEVVFYRNKSSKMSGEIGERTDSTINWTYLPDSRVTANNTPYSIKYTLDLPNNICSYDYYENNVFVGNYSKKITSINLADVDWKSLTVTQIGRGYGAVLGSINLPSISITVDGKEVFTGAKENYYMLRR